MTRKWMGALALCAAILIPAAARAQQAAGKTTVLKAARLFDGKSKSLVPRGRGDRARREHRRCGQQSTHPESAPAH